MYLAPVARGRLIGIIIGQPANGIVFDASDVDPIFSGALGGKRAVDKKLCTCCSWLDHHPEAEGQTGPDETVRSSYST